MSASTTSTLFVRRRDVTKGRGVHYSREDMCIVLESYGITLEKVREHIARNKRTLRALERTEILLDRGAATMASPPPRMFNAAQKITQSSTISNGRVSTLDLRNDESTDEDPISQDELPARNSTTGGGAVGATSGTSKKT